MTAFWIRCGKVTFEGMCQSCSREFLECVYEQEKVSEILCKSSRCTDCGSHAGQSLMTATVRSHQGEIVPSCLEVQWKQLRPAGCLRSIHQRLCERVSSKHTYLV